MSDSVSGSDLHMLVELVEQARTEGAAVGMPGAVLRLAADLIGCDSVSFLDLDPVRRRMEVGQGLEPGMPEPGTISDPVGEEIFFRHYEDCLPCSYPTVAGDDRTITFLSDFCSSRTWHSSPMYCEYLVGVEHEAMVCVGAPAGRTRRLVFFRSGGSDFDGRTRLLLTLLRPHLNEMYQELQAARQPAMSLTGRQRQLLELVARGYSNTDIAAELVVSHGTVRKHLENIFDRLAVTSRTAAVAAAMPAPPY